MGLLIAFLLMIFVSIILLSFAVKQIYKDEKISLQLHNTDVSISNVTKHKIKLVNPPK